MQNESEPELLERAQAGNRQALEELLLRHQAQVYRFGLKMCRDPEVAKDVLQDTMLAVARGIGDFRGSSSISTWLYTIARSFCIKQRRRSKFAPEEERSLDDVGAAHETATLADPSRGPDDALAGRRIEQALERAIASLEPAHREVLLLRDMEGLTAPEVAEVLGVSVQAVKSRLHRARLAVREHVAPLLGIPEHAPVAPGTCPDVLNLFSQHIEGEISPEVCAEMERHLEACARCRGTCDSLKRSLALCRTALPEAEVPAAVQSTVRVALQNFLSDRT